MPTVATFMNVSVKAATMLNTLDSWNYCICLRENVTQMDTCDLPAGRMCVFRRTYRLCHLLLTNESQEHSPVVSWSVTLKHYSGFSKPCRHRKPWAMIIHELSLWHLF